MTNNSKNTQVKDYSQYKSVPYADTDRLSILLDQAAKMRCGSWRDFFHKP